MANMTLKELEDALALLPDWQSRYEWIIDCGKKSAGLTEEEKKDCWLVKGCVSRVWVMPKGNSEVFAIGTDSDAIITRGLAAVVANIVTGLPAKEVAKLELLETFQRCGLLKGLSPNRAGGLAALIAAVQHAAKALLK